MADNMTSARYNIKERDPINVAAALRTIGFTVRCSVERNMASAGRTSVHWHVDTAPKDASDIIHGRAKSAALAERQSMYRVCMATLAIRGNLDVWLRSCADWYELTGTPRPDETAAFAKVPNHLLDFVAAAIAVGHLPRPRPAAGMPSILVTAASGTTLPMLGDALAAIQSRRGAIAKPITLPGAAPEEHPFLYAYHALLHLADCRADITRATGNPTGMFRGTGRRSALVSESILAADSRSEELLSLHLSGRL